MHGLSGLQNIPVDACAKGAESHGNVFSYTYLLVNGKVDVFVKPKMPAALSDSVAVKQMCVAAQL